MYNTPLNWLTRQCLFLTNAHQKFDVVHVICKPMRRCGMKWNSTVLVVCTVRGTVRNGDKTEHARRLNGMVRNENGNFFVTATVNLWC